MEEKLCVYCEKKLERKEGEKLANFRIRETCGHSCSGKLPRKRKKPTKEQQQFVKSGGFHKEIVPYRSTK